MTDTEHTPSAVKSAGRALEIIEHLAESEAQTFLQLLEALGLPR